MVRVRLQQRSGPTCGCDTKSALDHQSYIGELTAMTNNSSASVRVETSHKTETTQNTNSDALRRRAQLVLNDRSIDPQWRNIIRYALEINDPLLPDLVRRADSGERIIDTTEFAIESETSEDDSNEERVEALAEIICRDGDAAAALFVLMGTLENSRDPKLLANTAKHSDFNPCSELNLYGIVDAQIAVVESQLVASVND